VNDPTGTTVEATSTPVAAPEAAEASKE
jgi:hypothetical protein